MQNRFILRLTGIAGAFAAATLSGAASGDKPAALSAIQPGQWTLTPRDTGGKVRSICLTDPDVLIQIEHSGRTCERYTVGNSPRETTILYTCPGAGQGRTVVRVETPRLVQVQSEGIVDNEPFDLALEGRRTGECAVTSSR